MSKIYDDLTDKLTVIYSLSYARITFAATYRCFSRNFIIGLSARLTCKGTRGAHLARALGDTFRGAHVSVQLVSHDTGREKSACSGQAGLSVTAAAALERAAMERDSDVLHCELGGRAYARMKRKASVTKT